MLYDPDNKVLPKRIDPRKFAQQGVELTGKITVSDLPRVMDIATGDKGEIMVELSFTVDSEGHKVIEGKASGSVELPCQRCLDNMAFAVEAKVHLGVVWSEDQAKSLPKYLDPVIHGEGHIDLYDLIEEELLLALPMVAYHEHACIDESLYHSGEAVLDEQKGQAPNPFKVLEQLKGSPK